MTARNETSCLDRTRSAAIDAAQGFFGSRLKESPMTRSRRDEQLGA